jgi:hypothetical protein
MVWRFFATKLEMMEDVALNMRASYFYPTSTQKREGIQPMFAEQISPYGICSRKTKKATLVFGICLMLLLVSDGGYAMQPPPPPLNIAQLKILIAEANMIVVGKINAVKETGEAERTIDATLSIEKLLKGKVSGKTIVIRETYKILNSKPPGLGSRDEGESRKMIVSEIAGPSTYHGKYVQDARILVLLEKIKGTDQYRPLGSGTYDRHLCEFLMEGDGITKLYFQFAEDVGRYARCENRFIGFIEKLIKDSSNKEENHG